MKIKTLAGLGAFGLVALSAALGGEPPTWTAEYIPWFSRTGKYPLEYRVNAHDNDGDMVRIYGLGWDENNRYWVQPDEWRGDNWNQYMHGWAGSADGYTMVRYAFQDMEGAIFWEGEAPEWDHLPY